jgi:hypothetical protein
MVRDADRQNSVTVSRQDSSWFATRCVLQPEQRTLVDKSGIIRTQMGGGGTLYQKMVSVAWDTLYDTAT